MDRTNQLDGWRRNAFARAKAMPLQALVVIIVLRILSDQGLMRIQIGRSGNDGFEP